jgi:hypothetical protein
LRSLQAVLKTLLEAPNIHQDIDVDRVRETAFSQSNFTDQECSVVADLANKLRPYIPKRVRREDGIGWKEPTPHVSLRAPLVVIANTVLRSTGYCNFTRRVAPHVSPAALHGLHLGATGLYETFSQFEITVDGQPLTARRKVSGNERSVFASFFDINAIDRICMKYKLDFRNR